jgi:hypothetical protein
MKFQKSSQKSPSGAGKPEKVKSEKSRSGKACFAILCKRLLGLLFRQVLAALVGVTRHNRNSDCHKISANRLVDNEMLTFAGQ